TKRSRAAFALDLLYGSDCLMRSFTAVLVLGCFAAVLALGCFAAGLTLRCFAALPASAQQLVKERLPTCLACHGENGQSQNDGVPSLGGQQAFYVTVQLLMFREKMRVADPMNDMAKGLTHTDLQGFADIISQLPAPKPASGP